MMNNLIRSFILFNHGGMNLNASKSLKSGRRHFNKTKRNSMKFKRILEILTANLTKSLDANFHQSTQ